MKEREHDKGNLFTLMRDPDKFAAGTEGTCKVNIFHLHKSKRIL